MFRTVILCLLLSFVVPAVVAPARAAAADGKILDTTIDRYMEAAAKWEPRIKIAAKTMFWILATASMGLHLLLCSSKGTLDWAISSGSSCGLL